MKPHPCLLPGLTALLCATSITASSVIAQVPVVAAESSAAVTTTVTATPLEELVAPIALYPDALIALILPASASSSDIVLAARFLNVGGTANQIDTQPWDDSVKGLAHYPEVVKWMDENLSWTQRLGEAYLDQPQEVMAAVQRVRAQARANGVLVTTSQQEVIVEDNYIRIIPAQADVIYVPRYDPEIIYIERPVYYSTDPWLTFGIGFGVGSWLAYDLDWRGCTIWVDNHRHEHWREHRDWRYRSYPGRPGYVAHDPYWRPWAPLPGRPRPPHRDVNRWTHEVARPTPLPGAPRFDRDHRRGGTEHFAGGERRSGDHRGSDRAGSTQINSNHPGALSGPRPGAASNPAAGTIVNRQPAPAITVDTSHAGGTGQHQRSPSDRADRPARDGRISDHEQRQDRGTVSTQPTVRRWQPAVQPNAPQVATDGEQRMQPANQNLTRRVRPAPEAARPAPVVSSQPVPSANVTERSPSLRTGPRTHEYRPDRIAQPAAAPATAHVQPAPIVNHQPPAPAIAPAPTVRSMPQQREFRQPERIAQQPAAAPAPARVEQAPARAAQSDHGSSRSGSNEGNGRSQGQGRASREQEH